MGQGDLSLSSGSPAADKPSVVPERVLCRACGCSRRRALCCAGALDSGKDSHVTREGHLEHLSRAIRRAPRAWLWDWTAVGLVWSSSTPPSGHEGLCGARSSDSDTQAGVRKK